MKENFSKDNIQNENIIKPLDKPFPESIKGQEILQNSFIKNIISKSSNNYLKKINIIKLNIINSKLTFFEFNQPYQYLNPNHFSIINEMKKKYSNISIPKLKNLDKVPKKTNTLY